MMYLMTKIITTTIIIIIINRIENKQKGVERYQDFRRKLQTIWECKSAEVIPIVIGALGILKRYNEVARYY